MAADEHDAACLREIQPLVGVERHRVRPLEPREEVAGGRRRRRREAVRPVHVEPDPARVADVGERVDRVDCAGERRSRGGHHRDRRDARRGGRRRSPPRRHRGAAAAARPAGSARTRSEPMPRSSAERVRRSSGPRASSRGRCARRVIPGPARPRQRPLARRGERRDVRDRAATREGARRGGVADELAHPAHGLVLDLRRGTGPDREVGVEAGGEEVAEHADLEAGRAHEGEEARTRLRDRDVQDLRRVVERAERARSLLGQGRAEEPWRRSSTPGCPGRARSKLCQAPATIAAARSRASSRVASRRSDGSSDAVLIAGN